MTQFKTYNEIKRLSKKAQKLEDENCHTFALLQMAKAVNDATAIDMLKDIDKKHNDRGYLYGEIGEERETISRYLHLAFAKQYNGLNFWNL